MYGYITDVDICNLALNYLGEGALRVWTSVPSLPGLASSITIAIAGWR